MIHSKFSDLWHRFSLAITQCLSSLWEAQTLSFWRIHMNFLFYLVRFVIRLMVSEISQTAQKWGRQSIIWPHFPQRLHENERNRTVRGRIPTTPVGSVNH